MAYPYDACLLTVMQTGRCPFRRHRPVPTSRRPRGLRDCLSAFTRQQIHYGKNAGGLFTVTLREDLSTELPSSSAIVAVTVSVCPEAQTSASNVQPYVLPLAIDVPATQVVALTVEGVTVQVDP